MGSKRILPRLNEDINEEWISDKTRYSCDGLLKQRLDVPYIKKNNKLQKSTWDEALLLLLNKIKSIEPNEIGGHIGDMVNLESALGFKKLFGIFNSKNLEFREKNFYLNSSEKINYIFNSSIKGIEDTDLILLVGTNPRHEATILNARIRKTFVNKKFQFIQLVTQENLLTNIQKLVTKLMILKRLLIKRRIFKKIIISKKTISDNWRVSIRVEKW